MSKFAIPKSLSSEIYIMRQGNKVEKIMIQ